MPYCGDDLENIEKSSAFLEGHVLYICSNCKKLLGIESANPK